MTLSNIENRVKQDSAYPRTAEDAIRRDKDIDKVTIKASQIELEGYTTINGGFKIDKEGNMECNNATVTGGNIELKSSSDNPNIVIQNSIDTSLKTQFTGDGIVIHKWTGNIGDTKLSLSYHSIGDYASMLLTGDDAYMNIGNPHNSQYPLSLGAYNGGNIEIANMSGTRTINLVGSSGSITCVSLTQTSLAEKKKNFEKLENALDIVKDVDIYKYNLIDEKETDKKHIGFVIGENFNYRKEITSQENDGAELYSMISVLWKAVQEQQKEIEELRKLVNK